eukprot:SM000255S08788  [mRNA]  locus=s255:89513:99372:- [translate_table: standard]
MAEDSIKRAPPTSPDYTVLRFAATAALSASLASRPWHSSLAGTGIIAIAGRASAGPAVAKRRPAEAPPRVALGQATCSTAVTRTPVVVLAVEFGGGGGSMAHALHLRAGRALAAASGFRQGDSFPAASLSDLRLLTRNY